MAGLACARTLAAAGSSVRVIESSSRVGGRLGSTLVDGMWCDLGFQVSMSNYACLESLVPRDALERHSFIDGAVVWDGASHVRVIDPKRSPLSVPILFVADWSAGGISVGPLAVGDGHDRSIEVMSTPERPWMCCEEPDSVITSSNAS